MWQIEIYNRETRKWQKHGAPTRDFTAAFKKVGAMQETGNKVRLVKLAKEEEATE